MFENAKYAFKYALKSEAIKLSSIKLAEKEKEELSELVSKAVSFWSTPLYNSNLLLENEELKKKKQVAIDNFSRYLMIDTLYDLIVKKSERVYIHCSWDPAEGIARSVRASEVPTLYLPIKTHMFVYKDKILLDDYIYYDVSQSDEVNEKNRRECIDRSCTKTLKNIWICLTNFDKYVLL